MFLTWLSNLCHINFKMHEIIGDKLQVTATEADTCIQQLNYRPVIVKSVERMSDLVLLIFRNVNFKNVYMSKEKKKIYCLVAF